jgi:hypothetical protein
LQSPEKHNNRHELKQDGIDLLRKVLGLKNKWGARLAVPVVGDGLNIQALRNEQSRNRDSWESILRRIGQKAGISESEFRRAPQSPPLLWDMLVQRHASHTKTDLNDADLELGKRVTVDLSRLEQGLTVLLPIYRRLGSIWFENVISFNVDRRLAVGNGATFVLGDEYSGASVFYRHDLVVRDGCATRIWYPYGDSKDPQTFCFGRRWHADMVRNLEDYRTYLMLDWAERGRTLRPPDIVYRERLRSLVSWYDLFFLAPLVFIGVRLRLEAWPVWWLLHQRARNFVPFEKEDSVPPTIYLKKKGELCPELTGGPCEIQIIEFESHDELWEAFFSACEA